MGQGASKLNNDVQSIEQQFEQPIEQIKVYEENLLQQRLKQLKQQREILERYEQDVPTSKAQIKWMAEVAEKYKECPKKNIKVNGKYDIQGNLLIN